MLQWLQYSGDRWSDNFFAFGFLWGWQIEQSYSRWDCNRPLCADPTSSKAEDVFPRAAHTNSPIKTSLFWSSYTDIITTHTNTNSTSEWPHPVHPLPYQDEGQLVGNTCPSVYRCTGWIPSAAWLGHPVFSSTFLGSKSFQ